MSVQEAGGARPVRRPLYRGYLRARRLAGRVARRLLPAPGVQHPEDATLLEAAAGSPADDLVVADHTSTEVDLPGSASDPGLVLAIHGFLAREARLLDQRSWDEWLDLWAEDSTYSMPTRRSVSTVDGSGSIEDELVGADGTWWFDESRIEMQLRVAKLRTGKAWAEEPLSRTRRFVTNIEVEEVEGSDAFVVRSNVLIYRGRRDHDVEWFSCGRVDRVTPSSESFLISSRRVTIDTNVVAADNLILFL